MLINKHSRTMVRPDQIAAMTNERREEVRRCAVVVRDDYWIVRSDCFFGRDATVTDATTKPPSKDQRMSPKKSGCSSCSRAKAAAERGRKTRQ